MDSAESTRNQLERVFLEFCDFFYKIEGISVVASKSRYSEVPWLPVKFTVARYSETPWLPVKFTFARYSETGNQLLIPKAKYKSSCKSPTPSWTRRWTFKKIPSKIYIFLWSKKYFEKNMIIFWKIFKIEKKSNKIWFLPNNSYMIFST